MILIIVSSTVFVLGIAAVVWEARPTPREKKRT